MKNDEDRLNSWTSITVRKGTLLEFQELLTDMRREKKYTKRDFSQDDAMKELINLYKEGMK